MNYSINWSPARPTWKDRDFGSTWAKPRSWYLGRASMCFRSLAKTSGVCIKGVGTNSILSGGCSSWIHKECRGIPGCLKPDANWRCERCTGQARPINGRLSTLTRCRVGQNQWVAVRSHLPLVPITSRGRVNTSCVKSAMLHPSKTWAPYPTCIAFNVTTELWFVGCAVSWPRTKSARMTFWRGCRFTIWQRYSAPSDSDGTVI